MNKKITKERKRKGKEKKRKGRESRLKPNTGEENELF